MKTIWCLFSIANNYDQPDNNLVAWWVNKPTHAQIKSILETSDDVVPGKILRGLTVRDYSETEYRLKEQR